MSQLAFRWPTPINYTRNDFIVSESNRAAVAFIETWPHHEHETAALLSGPVASGKTHLTHCWMERTGGHKLDASSLGTITSEELCGAATHGVLENIETITNETAFFHLLRHTENMRFSLLMTSRLHIKNLPFSLPDVRSRLLAMPVVYITEPDEPLMLAYFTKAFADRQWRMSSSVIHYLVLHTERSFLAAQLLIQKLEQLVTTTNREFTIPLIKPLIA